MKQTGRLIALIVVCMFGTSGVAAQDERGAPSLPAQTASPRHELPAPETLLMMIRTTLAALHHANFTGNYTVLHALATPALQARTTPADLGIAFANLRQLGLDMSPALVLAPELSRAPAIAEDGRLQFAGAIATVPLEIVFEMAFLPVGNAWRLDALSVATRPAQLKLPAPASVPPKGP